MKDFYQKGHRRDSNPGPSGWDPKPTRALTNRPMRLPLVLQTEPKEVVWDDDSPITISPLRPLGTRRPWSTWVQRASTSMWTNSHRTNGRKANFFAVWRGRKSGVFYKWSDCKAALRGHMDPGFKGYRTLQEAYDGLRENQSRLKIAAER